MMKNGSIAYNLKYLLPRCIKACPFILITYIFVNFIYSFLTFSTTMVTKSLFDRISSNFETNILLVVNSVLILGIILIANQILKNIDFYLYYIVNIRVNGRMIFDFHNRVSKTGAIHFEEPTELDEINKALKGAGDTMSVVFPFIECITYYIPYFLLMSAFLYSIDPVLIAVMLIVFIPTFFGFTIRVRNYSKLEDESAPIRRQMDYYSNCLVNKEVRYLGGFYYFKESLKEATALFGAKVWKAECKTGLWELALSFCTAAGYITIILLLLHLIILGSVSVGAFAAIFGSIDTMFGMMRSMFNEQMLPFTKGIGAVDKYVKYMEKSIEHVPSAIVSRTDEIVLKNVCFNYPNSDINVLKNININIKQGETIAIVGENGAGKSTLSKIILGLYAPTSGALGILGREAKDEINKPDKNISGVFQNYERYKMLLKENIGISDLSNKNDDKVINVCNDIDIFSSLKFSDNIKDKLDTMLSREFDGIDLSGGQWQRIAIARGFYRDCDFIVLDEPTSAIDPNQETFIYECFSEISKGKTSVIITHRLGAAKIADRIILLHDGKVEEEGTHEELISKNGRYAKMYNAQSEWYNKSTNEDSEM